jgi:hypothetical protein
MVSGTRRIRGKHVENVPHSTLLYTFYSVESFSVESYQDQNVLQLFITRMLNTLVNHLCTLPRYDLAGSILVITCDK